MRRSARDSAVSLNVAAPIVTALIFASLAGCAGSPASDVGSNRPVVYFTDVAEDVGLGAFRHVNGDEGRFWFPEQMGAGGGFVDFDGDGWEDIVVIGGGKLSPTGPDDVVAVRLFRNDGEGAFEDVTADAGLADVRAYATGVTAADYDGDDDLDLYLTALGENLLFRNDPDSTRAHGRIFTEVGVRAGVARPASWSSSALFFDADNDGDPDLYAAGYARWSLETDEECHRSGGRPDYCPPATYPGDRSFFYRNNGDGTFTEETDAAGFGNSPGKSLAVAEWDFNRDGWSDVVVVNDGERDLLYLNDGHGTFAEKGMERGMALGEHGEARAGMGVDVGFVDDSGEPTVFVGNFSSEMIGVYRQTESGWMTDRAAASRIGAASLTTLAFGVLLFDAELDGDLDLFVANGHVYLDPIDGAAYRQPPHLFLNDGSGSFSDVADSAGAVLTRPMVARAVAKADYDRDGDVDLLVTENNGPVHLLRNDSRIGHVVRVRLRASPAGRDVLGTHVVAFVDGSRHENRVRTGSGYLSQSETTLTFGLGTAERIDSLVIRWPGGREERVRDVPAGVEVDVVAGSGIVRSTALPINPPPALAAQ